MSNKPATKMTLEGHAGDLLPSPGRPADGGQRRRGGPRGDSSCDLLHETLARAEKGELEEVEPADPYAELDNAYCINLPPHHHLNRMSRLMPATSGELVPKADLPQALEDCRKARRMTAAQRTANHKQCVAELEQEFSRRQAAAEQKRLADERRHGRVCCRGRLG